MLRFAGVPVARPDVDWLIKVLSREHSVSAQTVLDAIKTTEADGRDVVALTPEQRATIVAVLDDPPDRLLELRRELARERHRA